MKWKYQKGLLKVGSPDGDWADKRDDLMSPYILSCPTLKEEEDRVPVSVSLVQAECQKGTKPSNNLRIFNRHRPDGAKKGIAVCSKALSLLEDNSLRIIEWIELLRALGAEKVIIGVLSVHPNLMKVNKKVYCSHRSSRNAKALNLTHSVSS